MANLCFNKVKLLGSCGTITELVELLKPHLRKPTPIEHLLKGFFKYDDKELTSLIFDMAFINTNHVCLLQFHTKWVPKINPFYKFSKQQNLSFQYDFHAVDSGLYGRVIFNRKQLRRTVLTESMILKAIDENRQVNFNWLNQQLDRQLPPLNKTDMSVI